METLLTPFFLNLQQNKKLLRSGTAAGYDNVSISVVKESINLICTPLTYVINLSLNSGVVPY